MRVWKMHETRCERCKYYAISEEPFHYDSNGYPDGITVYGFCGKDARNRYVFFPVYQPDGVACKSFIRIKGKKRELESQVIQTVLEGMG